MNLLVAEGTLMCDPVAGTCTGSAIAVLRAG